MPPVSRSARPAIALGLAVALLAAVPALIALAVFGVIETPDSPGYLAYAAQIRAGAVPSGAALLREGPSPISLFRMGGYPALLAALQGLLPGGWRVATVLLQVAGSAALAAGALGTALALGARRGWAVAGALLPAIGFSVVVQLCLLTDALYACLTAGAALLLAGLPGGRRALLAGAMLGLATTLREATPLLAVAYLPLAWIGGAGWLRPSGPAEGGPAPSAGPGRRPSPLPGRAALSRTRERPRMAPRQVRDGVLACLAVLLLPVAVAAAQIAWNDARGAGPILTTSRQTVMVQAVLPLLKHHLPLLAPSLPGPTSLDPPLLAPTFLDQDAVFDAAARATVGAGDYGQMDALHARLFAAGMGAPAMARAASALYFRAWRRFPGSMLAATVQNFRHEFLAMPFEPVDTVGALMVYADWPRPAFDRLNLLWARLRGGDRAAGLWIALDGLTRLAGTAIALVAMVGPWLRGRDPGWRLRGLWCVCGGFVGVYLPVHLEPRYLVPAVPLACLIAACVAGSTTEDGAVGHGAAGHSEAGPQAPLPRSDPLPAPTPTIHLPGLA